MFEVTVTTVISAAHHLSGYKGKCENNHGHNYKVEATVGSNDQDQTGLTLDFGILRKLLEQVAGKFDHSCLNDHPEFEKLNPSSENLARVIYQALKAAAEDYPVKVIRIRVWETEGSFVTYYE
ncbi:MAG: 6-carboxytetrahydropterin synthase QueD [Deltaproteobacteria bacterium]|nr:6-carboxytetrahydropterin synthase QueD [Deltaproteobacteria bacterium]